MKISPGRISDLKRLSRAGSRPSISTLETRYFFGSDHRFWLMIVEREHEIAQKVWAI